MIARARCCRCGEVGKFDLGAGVATVEEAQAKVDGAKLESCPFGRHTELSPIRYEVVELLTGEAPTLEAWRADMIARGYDLWNTDELRATEIRIESFAFGMPMATLRGTDLWLDQITAPNGDRYYYAPAGEYARAVGQS